MKRYQVFRADKFIDCVEITNKCPYCGTQLTVEYIEECGYLYKMKKNGEPSKKRIKVKKYGGTGLKFISCPECLVNFEEYE